MKTASKKARQLSDSRITHSSGNVFTDLGFSNREARALSKRVDRMASRLKLPSYRCKHCGGVYPRESDKQWIKSFCMKTGKDARLVRLPS